MKKMMWMAIVAAVTGWAAAQDVIISLTGKVVKARSGQGDAMFYTLQENETGKKYEANTKRPDVLTNEAILKDALNSGRDLYIQFDMDPKWPDAVRRIKQIELK